MVRRAEAEGVFFDVEIGRCRFDRRLLREGRARAVDRKRPLCVQPTDHVQVDHVVNFVQGKGSGER